MPMRYFYLRVVWILKHLSAVQCFDYFPFRSKEIRKKSHYVCKEIIQSGINEIELSYEIHFSGDDLYDICL